MNKPQHQDLSAGLRSPILKLGVAICALAVAYLFGRHMLAMPHGIGDDEGYMLISLSRYFGGAHLYSDVFSPYGPFYYFVQRAVFGLFHLPVNHDAGRLVTLLFWLLSAILSGCFIYRLSRNTLLSAAAGLVTMWVEKVVTYEPGHPEQLILVMLLLGCCVSENPTAANLLWLGAFGTCLFFIKVNIGIFYFAAAVIALICGLHAGRRRSIGIGLSLLVAVVLPFGLMHHSLASWAKGYCLIAILCGVGTVLGGQQMKLSSAARKWGFWYVGLGAVLAAAPILIGTEVQGLSMHTLFDGILWAALRGSEVFHLYLRVSKGELVLALLIFAVVAMLYVFRGFWEERACWVDGLRVAAGLCVIWALVRRGDWWSDADYRVVVLYAFLPLILLRAKSYRWEPAEYFTRLFLTCLAATQFLQAYPVAGSQVSIGALPLLLWAFVCIHDGAIGLVPRMKTWWNANIVFESFVGGLIAVGIVALMWRKGLLRQSYPYPATTLAGTSSVHIPMDEQRMHERLADNVRANCDMLFTMPGMFKYNFWAGVPTPDGSNLPAWLRGIPLDKQNKTLQILQSDPQACVIDDQSGANYYAPDGLLEKIPLAHYILHDMRPVLTEQIYEIRVSPNRIKPWVEQPTAPH